MAQFGSLGILGLTTARSRQCVVRRRRTVLVLGVETLERRVVPSTITVTNANNDGGGSLREAIDLANKDPAQDVIEFASSVTGTITLLSAFPDLSTAINLRGPGLSTLTVARSSDPSTPLFRIFNVTAGAEVMISGLTIKGGRVLNESGGGIANSGTLTVTNSTLSGNSTIGDLSPSGGGIANFGTLTVTNSTLSGNAAGSDPIGHGGGIANNSGTATVMNSTLSGNAAVSGGGISNHSGTMTVTNSTLNGNYALRPNIGAGILNYLGTLAVTNSTFSGNNVGAIENNSGVLTITTSLFAGPFDAISLRGPTGSFVSRGHNLFFGAPAVALDPTDQININPMLAPLADNGGPTQTMALLPGSPAIDAGFASASVMADQRGVSRAQGTAPDIGAFESRGFSLVIVSGNNQSSPGGSAFPTPLGVRVASPFDEPVAGGRVTFVAPAAGASANFAANPAVLNASGLASVVATANSLGGPYAVTAQVAGASVSLAFALENLVIPPTIVGPTVVGLQRYGFHAQPTTLILRFSAVLDPTRAQDVANYQIVTLGGHGRGGSRVGQITRVRTAVYDTAIGSVTLHLARRLDLRNTYRLTVQGTAPWGVGTPTGILLDGAGIGQPGTDFVTTIDRRTLVRSSLVPLWGQRWPGIAPRKEQGARHFSGEGWGMQRRWTFGHRRL